jgi:hypothetical protein
MPKTGVGRPLPLPPILFFLLSGVYTCNTCSLEAVTFDNFLLRILRSMLYSNKNCISITSFFNFFWSFSSFSSLSFSLPNLLILFFPSSMLAISSFLLSSFSSLFSIDFLVSFNSAYFLSSSLAFFSFFFFLFPCLLNLCFCFSLTFIFSSSSMGGISRTSMTSFSWKELSSLPSLKLL